MKNTKKLVPILLLSVIGLFFLTNNSLSQQSTDQLFEKALYLEDATGDLQQAIEIYQQILKDNPENRNVGARALLHMGICFEKLGLRQARGTYQDVIKKYPEQQGEVAMATERLNRLNQYVADINKKAKQHFKKGNELMKLWEYESAINEFEKAIELDPGTLLAQNARYCIGQCWFKSGRYETALSTFEKLIKDFPESNIAPVTELMISQVEYAMENHEIPNLSINDSDENVIVDPETGITYNKSKTFAGKNEVYLSGGANMSPDCRFMVSEKRVVPMDGSDPFNLVDMNALRAIYSPDMKKAAFYADSAIWTVPVSTETGRSTGHPQKLLDGSYMFQSAVNWSPDGSQFAFQRVEKNFEIDIWTFSVASGDLRRITNSPGIEHHPRWSPDGKTIAYNDDGLWLASATGNENNMLLENAGNLHLWSPDSKWLFQSKWENNHFYSLDLNKNFELAFPEQVGEFISYTPRGDKMLFYRSSYDDKWPLKIVSASGGASYKPAGNDDVYGSRWLGESKHIMVQGGNEQGEITYKMISLSGGNSMNIEIEADMDGEVFPFDIVPGFTHIAFSVEREDGREDLYIAPFSVEEAKTTGPARMIFEGWLGGAYNVCISWSPDGKKLALIHEEDIWMIPLEAGNPVKLTDTPAEERWVDWSPDGKYISYIIYNQSEQTAVLHVIQPDEGISRVVHHRSQRGNWLSDSKSMAIFSDGELQIISLDGEILEHLLNLKDLGIDRPELPCLSPDGKHLAFIGYEFEDDKTFIIKYSFDSKKITKLAQDNLEDYKYGLLWSPDGKWLSYLTYEEVKVRPESSLWEADFEEVKQRLLSQE